MTTSGTGLATVPPTGTPTLWGLDPLGLHDHFWAARGVQVVRQGQAHGRATTRTETSQPGPQQPPSDATATTEGRTNPGAGSAVPVSAVPIVGYGQLFLLTEPRVAAILDLREPGEALEKLAGRVGPDLLYVRVRDAGQRPYQERVVSDAGGRFVRFERLYDRPRARLARAAFTFDVTLARAWARAASPADGWRLLRHITPRPRRGLFRADGLVYDAACDAHLARLARDLLHVWERPDLTVPRARAASLPVPDGLPRAVASSQPGGGRWNHDPAHGVATTSARRAFVKGEAPPPAKPGRDDHANGNGRAHGSATGKGSADGNGKAIGNGSGNGTPPARSSAGSKAGVYADCGAEIDPSAKLIGPLWIGAGRRAPAGVLVGPAILWDEPAARPPRPAAPALAFGVMAGRPARPELKGNVNLNTVANDRAARQASGAPAESLPPVESAGGAFVVAALAAVDDPWAIGPAARPGRGSGGGRKSAPSELFFKRAFDVAFSTFALLLTLPLYPLIALAVWLEDGGPVFFAHRRESLGGRLFPCLKFRSMRRDAERMRPELQTRNQADGPQFFISDDPRLTRVGRFLRKYRLDELPQFFNVLAGQMSVVGPRPSPFAENQFCPPWREARLSVRPGITGLWQVCRTRRAGSDFQEWIRYDLEYVAGARWSLDLWIIGKTLLSLLAGERETSPEMKEAGAAAPAGKKPWIGLRAAGAAAEVVLGLTFLWARVLLWRFVRPRPPRAAGRRDGEARKTAAPAPAGARYSDARAGNAKPVM